MTSRISPFLYPGAVATGDRLAIVHLKRDLQMPTVLKERDEDNEGYSEGKVVNTRFGSFPHKTLIGLPWGSQVRASKVDTGSRGRRPKGEDKKRKRDEDAVDAPKKAPKLEDGDPDAGTPTAAKEEAVIAASGFMHLLPPTPENWTSSLPHRTQVVYTPDYSYILHRIRARPGKSIIEAGAGSGSFTHASARAVFSGYPGNDEANGSPKKKKRRLGKVWSYEFHAQRHEKLVHEIKDHALEGVVEITHRDVCEGGFLVNGQSPNAEAIFLDLPAPWLALPHLSRSPLAKEGSPTDAPTETTPFISALSRTAPVYICTFSPCIEQVQRTVSVMRKLGWVDIEMVEVSQKRFEIRRDRIGIDIGGERGLQLTPASVDEAVARLKEVEGIHKSFHENGEKVETAKKSKENPNTRAKIMESLIEKKTYKEGLLVHKTEPEVKTHTSYLVFAILPREWSEEDERLASEKYKVQVRKEGENVDGEVIGMSRKQQKRIERQAMKDKTTAAKADVESCGVKDEEAVDVEMQDAGDDATVDDTPV
ncbi:uncharacterized protein L3040_002622 [Drepanopeziza brunnea f. sp. 'multigermtubi']|uniref:tRNA (adenine(58)-N(1))-methyltransferase catalytic subunit TRM61 n=1 Tax=Marssonina brunnea f. sp. multigermtubi (strain MB_m1) TaxID=1072389 RepID=K1XF36_MARBU|nr:uncharacterized protein MBM_02735 [Drepanopeziza brunnea f. sp. 'multigermtubi' MB_m1]EKD19498.1 hypothetical protein MBM_02735 [Drepanopeziza brunnea f. sp. 'multigermtubi' MB_m1]KAJ5050751.1 hypothetical protein L3040_002622 [Drepanopeziza brunnea f. sp. 'multigermtubi']